MNEEEWIKQNEVLVRAYQDIIRTKLQRQLDHERSLQSLKDAVESTAQLTLRYLEFLKDRHTLP